MMVIDKVPEGIQPMFSRYIGIDYSGAETPDSSLKGLRVYEASRESMPVEVEPPPSPRKQGLKTSARNNCTSSLSFGPSPALHPPAHITICTGESAWVTNQNPAPYCAIIYCRDPDQLFPRLWQRVKARRLPQTKRDPYQNEATADRQMTRKQKAWGSSPPKAAKPSVPDWSMQGATGFIYPTCCTRTGGSNYTAMCH
jgi:hypothetical protein